MKTLYTCEKCGATFSNYDDAYNCENNHFNVDTWSDIQTECDKRTEYKTGERLPSLITVPLRLEGWREDTNERYTIATYKLVSELNPTKKLEIRAESAARKAEAERQAEEWRKEREAKKALEDAQNTPTSEE